MNKLIWQFRKWFFLWCMINISGETLEQAEWHWMLRMLEHATKSQLKTGMGLYRAVDQHGGEHRRIHHVK